MRSNIVPGSAFPDYELPDHTGKLRKLSELQGDDPLILTLARGHYCPKEHQQHLDLAAFYPKIASGQPSRVKPHCGKNPPPHKRRRSARSKTRVHPIERR